MKTKWMMMAGVLWGALTMEVCGGISVTVAKTGTFTVTTPDGTKYVDQWILTAITPVGEEVTAYELWATGPMFQVWDQEELYDDDGNLIGYAYVPTPTMATAGLLSATQKQVDSHSLQSSYLGTPIVPEETNDLRFGVSSSMRVFGLGSDSIQYDDGSPAGAIHLSTKMVCGMTPENSATPLNFYQVGYCASEANAPIHIWGGAANGFVGESYDFWINRPAACRWIGAGTGGHTGSAPIDPTTQWNTPSNWLHGKVPGAEDIAQIDMDCGGTMYAASGEVQYLCLDGQGSQGVLRVSEGVNLTQTDRFSSPQRGVDVAST